MLKKTAAPIIALAIVFVLMVLDILTLEGVHLAFTWGGFSYHHREHLVMDAYVLSGAGFWLSRILYLARKDATNAPGEDV